MEACQSFQPNPFKTTQCKNCQQPVTNHSPAALPPTNPSPSTPTSPHSSLTPPQRPLPPSRPSSPHQSTVLPRKPPQRPNKPQSLMVAPPSTPSTTPTPQPHPPVIPQKRELPEVPQRNTIRSSSPVSPPPPPRVAPPRHSQLGGQMADRENAPLPVPPKKERKTCIAEEKPIMMEGTAPHIRTSVPDPGGMDGAPELLTPPGFDEREANSPSLSYPPSPFSSPGGGAGEGGEGPMMSNGGGGARSPRGPRPTSPLPPVPPVKKRPLPPPKPPLSSKSSENVFLNGTPPMEGGENLNDNSNNSDQEKEESTKESEDEDDEDSLVSIPERAVLIEPPPPPFQPQTKREYLVVEILTTERTYVTNLRCLIDTFLVPLREQCMGKAPLLLPGELEVLFSNVEDISKVNGALLEELEGRLSNWSDTQTIGDAVRRLIPFLKMYHNYTANYEKAQVLLADLMNRNLNFAQRVKKWECEVVKMDMIPLPSYLILPVQRIPRYNMLLRDFLKTTEESHPDYKNLGEAVKEMEEVANYINDEIQKAESRAKMIEIQYMFLALAGFELVIPSRHLLLEGELMKVCRKAHKPRQFFMFNDGLLYAEIVTARYIFRKFMPISTLKVKDIAEQEVGEEEGEGGGGGDVSLSYKNAFVIRSSQKSFVVYTDNADVKQKWLEIMRQTIEDHKRAEDQKRREKGQGGEGEEGKEGYEAPVWIPDDAVDRCLICRGLFTFLNRRHHCRSCGRVVCSSCSSNKLFLGETYAQKVCIKCYEEFKGGEGEAGEKGGKEKKGEGAGEEGGEKGGKEDDRRSTFGTGGFFRKFSIQPP